MQLHSSVDEAIEQADSGAWVEDTEGRKDGHYRPGDEIDLKACSMPGYSKAFPWRTAEEWRLDEESYRQMEYFWSRVFYGGAGSAAAFGAFIVGGPPAAAAVLKLAFSL